MKVSRKGIPRGVKLTKTTLRPSNRGRNKRGITSSKRTKGARRAKGQLQTGYAPRYL